VAKSGKGAGFEREACRQLSVWWSRKGDDDLFWRTHSSGARATSRSKVGKKTKGQYGDICATDSRGAVFTKAFVISLKRGYSQATSIQDLFDNLEGNSEPQVCAWIREAERDLDASGALTWLLIIRRDRRKAIVLYPTRFESMLPYPVRLVLGKSIPYLNAVVNIRKYPSLTRTQLKTLSAKKLLRYGRMRTFPISGTTVDNFLTVVNRKVISALINRSKMET
jgi:hypothetical protein